MICEDDDNVYIVEDLKDSVDGRIATIQERITQNDGRCPECAERRGHVSSCSVRQQLGDLRFERGLRLDKKARQQVLMQKQARKLEKRHPLLCEDSKRPAPMRDANVWCLIFRWLPQRDIAAVCATCKTFNCVVDEMDVLQSVTVYGENRGRAGVSSGDMGVLRKKLNLLSFLTEDLKFSQTKTLLISPRCTVSLDAAKQLAELRCVETLDLSQGQGSCEMGVGGHDIWQLVQGDNGWPPKLKVLFVCSRPFFSSTFPY